MLYKPKSRKIAQCYKGTKLRHRWPDDCQGFQGGFYEAKVVAVPQIPVEGDEGGVYLTLECTTSIPPIQGLQSIQGQVLPASREGNNCSLRRDHND